MTRELIRLENYTSTKINKDVNFLSSITQSLKYLSLAYSAVTCFPLCREDMLWFLSSIRHINFEGGTETQGDIAPIIVFVMLLVVLRYYYG